VRIFPSVGHDREPCEMPFGMYSTRLGPDPPREGANLGNACRPIVEYSDYMQRCGVDVAYLWMFEYLQLSSAGAAHIAHAADESIRRREGGDAACSQITLGSLVNLVVDIVLAHVYRDCRCVLCVRDVNFPFPLSSVASICVPISHVCSVCRDGPKSRRSRRARLISGISWIR